MNYFQHSGFPWSVENQGKTKILFFKGRKKSGNSLKSQKRLKTKIGTLMVYNKSKQMLACITGIIFCIFRRAKSKQEASEEHQTHVMRKGVLSVAPHSIYACLCTPSHAIEKITPVMQASKCKASLDCFFIYYSPNARSVKSRGIFEGQV